jgi:hypothetical protein
MSGIVLTVRITTALMKTDSRMEPITMEVVVMMVVESRPSSLALKILFSLSAYIGCNE